LAAWLIPIEERIALLRASADQTAVTLSQRQSRALAGEWYRAQVALYEENPGRPEDWWFTRQKLEPDDREDREAGRVRPTAWLIEERDKLLLERELRLTAGAVDTLLQEMVDLWVSLCALMERRAEGDYGPDLRIPTIPAVYSDLIRAGIPK
jgi:hypothetical protein